MFADLLEKLRRHEDLTAAEAEGAMARIMDGEAQPAHMAALLMALALKGERPAEMVGFARAMRARAMPMPRPVADVFDTCGTGGDGAHTFNVSTAAALVLAGAGVRVAKHGNRAVSSRCGAADVFEALGIRLDAPADRVVTALEQANLAFFFAPMWHPSMKHAGATRKELGVRTAFNLLGPLTNPAGARRQVIGVSRPEHTELVARTLGALGAERAWVVHGAGGLDEISTLGHTKVSELATAPSTRSTSIRRTWGCRPVIARRSPAAPRRRTRRWWSGCSTANAAHAATSCCSMQPPRCSSPARRLRFRTA